ncbi:hypothetical protein Agabi119p4_9691 [Agaricus bisporus var. burnettii]|uniref:F-box domain-containing protein n=1 Tax=Agaricus bisporus var. burnettii TaxID=192524 RepID=A0A8H7C2W1_AGABI|nr:hypothetical protein Agabi119p4_9691 [Agaricus bisporus var. burnettii]
MSPTSTETSSRMLCGCQCKGHWFTVEARKDEPDFIYEDIERLNEVIDHFRILKAQRLRQFNKIHSSMRNLPNEILLSIFEHYCSLVGPRKHPVLTLGAVSAHWRDLVENSSQLWTRFDLVLSDEMLPGAASLLEMYREHNGSSFESIQLDFRMFSAGRQCKERRNPIQRLVQSIKTLETFPRIKLHQPPVDLLRILNNDLNVPEVHLSNPPHLVTGEKTIPRFSFPWLALTTLKLCQIQVDVCTNLLLGCPNLVEFSTNDPLLATDECIRPTSDHAHAISFPKLRYLSWYHAWRLWDDNLLSFYRFPALEYFDWRGNGYDHSLNLFSSFIISLPQSCRTIQISAGKENNMVMKLQILQLIKNHPIDKLICSHFDILSLHIILERLKDSTFIPSLNFFKWEQGVGCDTYESDRIFKLTRLFKDVLRCRHEMGVVGFRMEIDGLRTRVPYNKHEVYKIMEGSGFDIDIAEDGRWIMSIMSL